MASSVDRERSSTRRALDDLAALRAAEARRRRETPGTPEFEAAIEEERIVARRIRTWVEDRPRRQPPT